MKILTTKAQLRYTLESGRRIIFEPGAVIQMPPSGPPVITAVTPNSGSSQGGDTIIITGHGFTAATEVWFGVNYYGNNDAWDFTVDSDTQITATSAGGNGAVDVQVSTPVGTSSITAADQFTYVKPAVWWPEQVMDWDVQIAGGTIYSAYTSGSSFWIGMNSLSAPTRTITDPYWVDLMAADPMATNWAT